MAINAALVRFTYPHRLLGRAIGLNALVVSVGSAAGPPVAAAILAVASWPWLFLVNGPIGLLALVVAQLALPRIEPVSRPFDLAGAALNAVAFGAMIAGVDLLTRTNRPVLGTLALVVAVAAGGLLAFRGRAHQTPLLPVDLLRIPIFGLSVATSVCSFAAQMLAFVSLPFLFEGPMGRSAAETGLLLTPWPIAVGLVAPLAGGLSDRFPAAILSSLGLVILAAGLATLALLPEGAANGDVAWRMAVCGLGFGLFQAPNNRTMIAAAPRSRAGAAGGMLATARLVGQTAGATTVAAFFALVPERGEALSLSVAVALALAGAAASVARLSSGRV